MNMATTTTTETAVSPPAPTVPDVQTLRKAIPPHCLRPKPLWSAAYIVRDVTIAATLAYLALSIQYVEYWPLRWALWTAYGFVQGLIFTGIWILAHECGHQALFKNSLTNDSLGFALHSLLFVPYFSWKYSHARHHRYTNNLSKDTAFVPSQKDDFSAQSYLAHFFEIAEDAPALNAVLIVGHQFVGWPLYMLFALTAGEDSKPAAEHALSNSHFDPLSSLFSPSQRLYIFLSDLGLLTVLAGLWQLSQHVGYSTTALLYLVPYLWVNHWIVAITFLHHTHQDASHYEDQVWTFQKGALATVDRDFGSIGRYLFHGIIEYHVIHHLFPRIPFYHAEEATKAIEPLLGAKYLREETSFLQDFWNTFRKFRYVESAADAPGEYVWAHACTGTPSVAA